MMRDKTYYLVEMNGTVSYVREVTSKAPASVEKEARTIYPGVRDVRITVLPNMTAAKKAALLPRLIGRGSFPTREEVLAM